MKHIPQSISKPPKSYRPKGRPNFYIQVTVHRNIFLFKQPTRHTNYPNVFCYKTLNV